MNIPRVGVYWPVLNQLVNPLDLPYSISIYDDQYRFDIQFESKYQSLISTWLVGFSYKQLLKIFPEYKDLQAIRNAIFPRSLGKSIELRVEINNHPPRQLVDSEYIDLANYIGKPESKIDPKIYKLYMDWVQHKTECFWLSELRSDNDVKSSLKKLIRRRESLITRIANQQKTLEKVEQQIEDLQQCIIGVE